MRKPFFRPALLLGLSCTMVLAGKRDMTGVPLAWTPTSTLAEAMGPLNLLPLAKAKIWVKPFTDSRADKNLVAENQEDKVTLTVRTNEDVAAFLRDHLVKLYREAGLPMAATPEEATVIVSAEVLSYKVTEKDTYEGELSLVVQVEAGGKPLWRGTLMGHATRWGRSYKLENYYEALSDSLVDAVSKSLKSEAYLQALANH